MTGFRGTNMYPEGTAKCTELRIERAWTRHSLRRANCQMCQSGVTFDCVEVLLSS